MQYVLYFGGEGRQIQGLPWVAHTLATPLHGFQFPYYLLLAKREVNSYISQRDVLNDKVN